MTLIYNGLIMSTTLDANEVLGLQADMQHARDKWLRDGGPQSGGEA